MTDTPELPPDDESDDSDDSGYNTHEETGDDKMP